MRNTPVIPGLPLSLLLGGCVVAVSASVEISEPVDAVDITLGVGDLSVETAPGNILLEAELGGLSDSELDYDVVDRVLFVDASCDQQNLCGGTMDLTMPARTDLTARVTTGSVDLDGLGGNLYVSSAAGTIRGTSLTAAGATLVVDVGDVDVSFARAPDELAVRVATGDVTLRVPSGAYDLDIRVDRGSVDTRGVTDEAGAASLISVTVDAGAVTIIGR